MNYWRQLRAQHIKPAPVYNKEFQAFCQTLSKRWIEEHANAHDQAGNVQQCDSGKQEADAIESEGRKRRRSLAGVNVSNLLQRPLSKTGQLLLESGYALSLDLELDWIDKERSVLLKLVAFFQAVGEYNVALDFCQCVLDLMEKMPKSYFGVVEICSMLVEMALLERKLHALERSMQHLEKASQYTTSFMKKNSKLIKTEDEASGIRRVASWTSERRMNAVSEVTRLHNVILGDKANLLRMMRDYDVSLEHYRMAVEWTDTNFGQNDIQCAVHLNNMANLFTDMSRYEEALDKYKLSYAITKAHYGEEHPETARTLHNIGLCLKKLGQYSEAVPCFEDALQIMKGALGMYHPEVGTILNSFSILYCMSARRMKIESAEDAQKQKEVYVKAQQTAERSVVIRERSLGTNHPSLAGAYTNLGKIYGLAGDMESSRECYERSVAISEQRLGESHPLLGRGLATLGRMASKEGDFSTARDKLNRALRTLKLSLGVMHAFTRGVQSSLDSISE